MFDAESEFERVLSAGPDPSGFPRPAAAGGLVLYGAGKMGKMALDLMRAAGMRPDYVLDRNPQGELGGLKVLTPGDVPDEDRLSKTVLVCLVTAPFAGIQRELMQAGFSDVRHFYAFSEASFPGIMPNGWAVMAPAGEDIAGMRRVLNLLAHDGASQADYLRCLWWRLRRRDVAFEEFPPLYTQKYFSAPEFPGLRQDEVFVDGGAHLGLTVKEFIRACGGRYAWIHAFEPDRANLSVLRECVSGLARVTVHAKALTDKDGLVGFREGLGYASSISAGGGAEAEGIRLDSISGLWPTVIKLHIEGGELPALRGAGAVIRDSRPILMVLGDHSTDGLYRIADFLAALDAYRLYFHMHDHCGNTSIFYAYPAERLK